MKDLEDPVGDWMKIAKEIQVFVEEATEEDRTGPVQLEAISPYKLKKDMKLTYTFWATSLSNLDELVFFHIEVSVTPDGRILRYVREWLS